MKIFVAAIIAAALGAACTQPTEFHGSSTLPEGRATCEAQCAAWGMELAGMVSMGEGYTEGCICAVPERPASAVVVAGGQVIAGVVGVELQKRRLEEQRRQQQSGPAPSY